MNVYEMFCTEYECDSCPHLVCKKEDIVARDAKIREKIEKALLAFHKANYVGDDNYCFGDKTIREALSLLEEKK